MIIITIVDKLTIFRRSWVKNGGGGGVETPAWSSVTQFHGYISLILYIIIPIDHEK